MALPQRREMVKIPAYALEDLQLHAAGIVYSLI